MQEVDALMSAAHTTTQFSIFDPAVRLTHRESHEEILWQLNGLFPICNRGKCGAIEISDNAIELEQITDLMTQVERFAGELLEGTERLFEQFYTSTQVLSRELFFAIASNNITLMQQSLVHSTRDVQQWSLEPAFEAALSAFKAGWTRLESVRNSARGLLAGTVEQVRSHRQQQLAQLCDALEHPEHVLLRDVERTRFVELAGSVGAAIGELLPDCPILEELKASAGGFGELERSLALASDRLETLALAYPMYRDLVLTDSRGLIVASANRSHRTQILGTDVSQESWFVCMQDGDKAASSRAQHMAHSQVATGRSVVYVAKVEQPQDSAAHCLGVLGAFMNLDEETSLILGEHLPTGNNAKPLEGWCAFFSSASGDVIASSDPEVLRAGDSARLPLRHRHLGQGEHARSDTVVDGMKSSLYSANVSAELQGEGLAWTGHLVLPRDLVFEEGDDEKLVIEENVMECSLVSEHAKQIYRKVQVDKQAIQLISLNGMIFASKLGRRGLALGPIFDQITEVGDQTTHRMEQLVLEMVREQVRLRLRVVKNLAAQAANVLDRTLFERVAQVRWWATDPGFWQALESGSSSDSKLASERLAEIHRSHANYRSFVLANADGEIIGCSAGLRAESRRLNVSDSKWFQDAMRNAHAREYAVQEVTNSPLESEKDASLVYAGTIRAAGATQGEPLGVIGVLFDWDTEAHRILEHYVPRTDQGEILPGAVAVYTNAAGVVVETTDRELLPTGVTLDTHGYADLKPGDCAIGTLELDSVSYLLASSQTKGHSDWKGLGWTAHVILPR